MPPAVNLTGQKFNHWTVLSRNPTKHKESLWNCVCRCGTEAVITASNLRGNKSKSCGCWRDERNSNDNSSHGMSGTLVYISWQRMKDRCLNPNNPKYKDYGGRGIKVYEEWLYSFETFYAYVGDPPSSDHSLDRFPNNNGNYEPGNVRWASREEQGRNKRNNVLFTVGDVSRTLPEWAEVSGIKLGTLCTRIYGMKMAMEDAIKQVHMKPGPKPK